MVVDEQHSDAGHGSPSLAATPRPRPYAAGDWQAVLSLCLEAFAPACVSLGRSPQAESRSQADPDWRTSIARYLRSLTRSGEKKRLLVVELRGSVVGVVHYEVDAASRSGRIGVSAVHPAAQGQGVGTAMYDHVLEAMRAQGVAYVTADTEGDASHASARRVYEKLGFVAVPMVHYFKCLDAPGPGGDGGRERARARGSSGSRGGRGRR